MCLKSSSDKNICMTCLLYLYDCDRYDSLLLVLQYIGQVANFGDCLIIL